MSKKKKETYPSRVTHPESSWFYSLKGAVLVFLVVTVGIFASFIFSGKALYGSDAFPAFANTQLYQEYIQAHGQFPLWQPYIISGIPYLDGLAADAFFPTSLLKFILPLHKAVGLRYVIFVILGGMAMFSYLRRLKLVFWASLAGSLGFMLSSAVFTLLYSGHDSKFFLCMMIPMLFWAIEYLFENPTLLRMMIMGGVMGSLILTGHPQMAYFSFIPAGFYFLMKLVGYIKTNGFRTGSVKLLAGGLIAVILALMIGSIILYPSTTYISTYSPRSGGVDYEYASSWSMHPEEVMMLFIPQFVNYNEFYWGRNYFKLNSEYIGLIAMVLGIISAIYFFRRLALAKFLSLTAVFTLFYALGSHTLFHKFCYYFIPGINRMRAPSMSMPLFAFSMWTLSALLIHHLFTEKEPASASLKKIIVSVWGSLTGLGVIFFLAREQVYSIWQSIFNYPLTQDKLSVMQQNVVNFVNGTGIYLLALAVLGLILYWLIKGGNKLILGIMLCTLICLDLIRTDRDFVQVVEPEQFIRQDDVIDFLKTDSSLFRVFSWTNRYMQNVFPIHHIYDAGGFHDFELRWYREFRGGRESRNFMNSRNNFQMLDLANVKYIIIPDPERYQEWKAMLQFEKFKPVFKSRQTGQWVLQNDGVLPRYRIVHRYTNFEVYPDSGYQTVIASLVTEPKNVGQELYIENFDQPFDQDSSGQALPGETIEIQRNDVRELDLTAHLLRPGFVVLSENYFPYWKASVNGKEIPIYRAYGTYRALFLPAGDHPIRFTYHSRPVYWGSIGTSLGVLLFLLAIGSEIFITHSGKKTAVKV